MTIYIGLGNPDKEYKNNRHNAGRIFIDWLYSQSKDIFSHWETNKKLLSETASTTIDANKIILAKPSVYMNESGKTALALKRFYKARHDNIIIIHDESDLNIGDYKISINKNAAGHHGVESIYSHLKTKEFIRIRVGIRPEMKSGRRLKAKDFVLKDFSKTERETLEKVFTEIARLLPLSK